MVVRWWTCLDDSVGLFQGVREHGWHYHYYCHALAPMLTRNPLRNATSSLLQASASRAWCRGSRHLGTCGMHVGKSVSSLLFACIIVRFPLSICIRLSVRSNSRRRTHKSRCSGVLVGLSFYNSRFSPTRGPSIAARLPDDPPDFVLIVRTRCLLLSHRLRLRRLRLQR
jgi:hypothetical protein